MKRLLETDLDGIKSLAKTIAKELKGGEIFALIGTLGAGKTTFAQALGRELKVRDKITSPTFNLLQAFEGKIGQKKILFYHLDLYRTKNFREVKALGLTEFWGKPNTVTLIEWADKIRKHLPAKTKVIRFGSNSVKPLK